MFGRKVRLNKKAPRLLYERVALPDAPWVTLHRDHVRRLKSDAASIAVPTADADAKSRLERLEHWLSVGLDVLNVAAMFVPLLNPIMMTIGAAQIMGSVFHGIEAWEDDDTAQALAQVESIAVDIASAATLGAGLKALKASGFVDALQSIRHDGEERLWRPDLTAYQSPVELPAELSADAQGLYTLDGKHYVRIEGHMYALEQSEHGEWSLLQPDSTDAYRPRLSHNGHGAWRLTLEQPLDWSDLQLMRRLGPVTDGLEDTDLIMAMAATGTDADVLRRVHIDGQRPPALLIDALKRLRTDRRLTMSFPVCATPSRLPPTSTMRFRPCPHCQAGLRIMSSSLSKAQNRPATPLDMALHKPLARCKSRLRAPSWNRANSVRRSYRRWPRRPSARYCRAIT